MIVTNCHFKLWYREDLGCKNKMPEYIIQCKVSILICTKIIFIVKYRIIITNIKLVKMMCGK